MEKTQFTREFEDFGIKMYVLAILSIISIFTGGLIQLAMFIIMLFALGDIKKANLEMQNEKLENFRKYIIYAVIVGIVGAILIIAIIAIIVVLFFVSLPGFTFSAPITVSEFQQISPLIEILLLILLGGLPVGAIALGLLVMAWNNFYMFLSRNSGLFPAHVAEKATEGAAKIKKSYLYLLISLIIGAVLVLIAFFVYPQIEAIIIDFIEGTTPSVEQFGGLIALFAIPGIGIAILGIASFILMILGYFRLSELKHL
ncbi:MAG: membrane protein of unknown function [Promethearchaeota archaeon]|nr:MAG: membrane protein of unknown function [Candidatus Lokiarchaeota archaeon]